MRLRFVMVLGALCVAPASAPAQITEATAAAYVKKVEMPVSTQNSLKQQAETIINTTYGNVLSNWNQVGANKFSARTMKLQFQGSLGYNMALSLPAGAKSDVDVAFLYLYNSGNNQPQPPNPPSPSFSPVQLKELAQNVFKNAYPAYTYEIKDPVVVIQQGTGTAADHFDVAFFDELIATGATPPSSTCVNTAVKTSPCSELNWGTSPTWGTTGNQQNWSPNDRLNLNGTLNAVFDRSQDSLQIHEAGKIFKEWRYQAYTAADSDVDSPEKPPSIALVTLLYNFLKTKPSTYYNNAFVLLRETIQYSLTNNFRNNCSSQPPDFQILSITYPNSNLLSKMTQTQKKDFCTKLTEFKGALDYATAPGTTEAQAIARLQSYLPLFP